MRRLVIGIMLALFAVGAYSQEDDMYVFQKSKKEKHSEIKTLMKSQKEEVRKLDKQLPKKDIYQREKEHFYAVFQSLVGEWTTKEGQLINIEIDKIEIKGVVVLKYNIGDAITNMNHNGYTVYRVEYTIPHPFIKEEKRSCDIEIIEFDEDHIILTIDYKAYDTTPERDKNKTYRLTRVY